jgi:crossover junction endodeoxyribonuclease RusA
MEPAWLTRARRKGIVAEGRQAELPGLPSVNEPLTLELPYPPTVNHYWRTWKDRVLLSEDGRRYRRRVAKRLERVPFRRFTGPLQVEVLFNPPDGLRRDLDNLPKGLLDALQKGGVYGDDSQIKDLHLRMGPIVAGGRATVTISELR